MEGAGTMTLMEAIAELSNRAIEEMGAPLTLIVAGTDLWVSISRYDAERQTKVLLDAIGEPDDHLPLLRAAATLNRNRKRRRLLAK
jgi:hypothetical protein